MRHGLPRGQSAPPRESAVPVVPPTGFGLNPSAAPGKPLNRMGKLVISGAIAPSLADQAVPPMLSRATAHPAASQAAVASASRRLLVIHSLTLNSTSSPRTVPATFPRLRCRSGVAHRLSMTMRSTHRSSRSIGVERQSLPLARTLWVTNGMIASSAQSLPRDGKSRNGATSAQPTRSAHSPARSGRDDVSSCLPVINPGCRSFPPLMASVDYRFGRAIWGQGLLNVAFSESYVDSGINRRRSDLAPIRIGAVRRPATELSFRSTE